MSIDAILRLERTTLFELLIAREKLAGSDHEISERVRAVIAHVAPLMERIPDKMPEYTLHDPNHGAKVVELMGLIIPSSTLNILNPIELSILIYAGYLHDLGMTCSTAEREKIIESDENFAQLLASDTRRSKQIEAFRASGNHRSATHVEDQVFTEYLRRHHVRRSATFIESELSHGAREIAWRGTAYWRLVQAVCDSHALPVRDLRDTRRWPRDALVRNVRVNVQYLALVLRLGDILDLDPERTPKVLLDFIDPNDPTSIVEWNKHRSIIGWEITPERIRFEAECSDAVYERALREFIGWIEVERSDSVALASSYRDDIAQAYHLDLTDPVTADRIRSDGSYIFSTLRFEVDHERVINLLMGERLYRSPAVALRELIQNAFDAMRFREALEKRDDGVFVPKLAITLDGNQLSVEDNGIGMDTDTIKNYFMQVGRSYYSSPQFRSQKLDLDIVSEFGIGMLSAFMVADRLTVESRRRPDNPLSPPEPVLVEIPTAHRYFVQRPSKRSNLGTKITLSLKDGHPFSGDELFRLVEQMVPFGEYPILIQVDGKQFVHPASNAGSVPPNRAANQYEFLKFTVDSSTNEDLKGVSGTIRITGKQDDLPHRYSNHSIIAHCGFAIFEFDREEHERNPANAFTPDWTEFAVNLDFRPPARLALTPDRGSIVYDERFERIRRSLDRLVVHEIRQHLVDQMSMLSSHDYADYIDQMIENEVLKGGTYVGFTLSVEARDLFLDYIPFKCIDEDGCFSRVMGRILDASEVIILADPRGWPEDTDIKEIRRDVDAYFGKKYPIVVDHDVGDYHRESMYEHLFPEISGHLISTVPGVVLEIIERHPDQPIDSTVDGVTHFSFGFKSTKKGSLPAFSHMRGSNVVSFQFPLFNARHPFFFPLLEEFSSDVSDVPHGEFITELHERIIDILSESVIEPFQTKSTAKRLNRQRRKIRDSILLQAPNKILTGILSRDGTIFPAIKSAFVEYWQTVVEAGAIAPDFPMPNFTVADLPWFWSVELSSKEKLSNGDNHF